MSKRNSEEVITLNIEPFILPGAILLGAILISISLLIGLNNIGNSTNVTGTSNTGSQNNLPDSQAPTGPVNARTTIGNNAVKGDQNSAKVAIVEFTDLDCPFCARHHQQTMPTIIKNFVDNGSAIYVIRDNPIPGLHPNAQKKAEAAECVRSLSNDSIYFEYLSLLFKNQNDNADSNKLGEYAGTLGVNKDAVKNCIDEGRFAEEVAKDLSDGGAAGISGTPSFVVGKLNNDGSVEGEIVVGAQPYSEFERIISKYL